MSQARENLKNLTAAQGNDEEGYVAMINAFAAEYKADTEISPFDWDDLNKRQKVAHFGGYLVAQKGFNAHQVFAHANTIVDNTKVLDLSADKPTIIKQLEALGTAAREKALSGAALAIATGDNTDAYAKAVAKQTENLITAWTVTPTSRARLLMEQAHKALGLALGVDVLV